MKIEKSHLIIGIAIIALIAGAYYTTQPLTIGTDNIYIDVPASNNLEVDAVGDYTTVVFKMYAPQGAGGYIIRMYNPYISPDGNERKRTVIVEAGESLPKRVQFDNIHVEKLDEWYVDLMSDKYTILNQFSFDFTLSGPVPPDEEPTPAATPDPCAGITCNDYCAGTVLYTSGVCSNGQCDYQTQPNSVQCGYVIPTDPDPCVGVSCNDYCAGTTLYHTGSCVNGQCSYQQDYNNVGCGYTVPTPTATPTPTDDEDGIGGILWYGAGIIGVLLVLLLALKAKR